MPGSSIQVVVDGHWLSRESMIGEIEMSTIWPGGSDELSWAPGDIPVHRYAGGELVEGRYGGVTVWAGSLLEPDPSQDRVTAQGAWREGDEWTALTAVGAASAVPDTASGQAITRGLQWTRPASISNVATEIDITQGPVTVGQLLDTWAENNTTRWSVNTNRELFSANDDTLPTWQTVPLDGGLGYATDNYASTLICRYFDSATSTYKTLPAVTDTVAEGLHGHVEAVVDLTGRGPITAARATAIANSLLSLGRSTPQWTKSIEVSFGEILNMGGTPVALEIVAAGEVVRVHGGFELAQRKNAQMYIDALIGQTHLADGTLTLQPYLRATRTFQDFVTEVQSKKWWPR